MAYKKFNATETEYTGTSSSDIIIGNDLGNFIDGGDGNDIIIGGAGNDILLGGNGHDAIDGGDGDDVIDLGNGNNIAYGGDGADNIFGGDGVDVIDGGDGDDYIFGGDGDDILTGGEGADIIFGQGSTAGNETVNGNVFIATSDDYLEGSSGNDTFVIGSEITDTFINAGVSGLDNAGDEARYVSIEEASEEDEDAGLVALDTDTGLVVEIEDQDMAEQAETDVRLNIAYRPGSSEVNTAATTIAGYNAVDTLAFTQSGDFDELAFSGIERIELASGVNITLSSEQFEENGESLSLGFLNPGAHVYGVAGGPTESVTIEMEYEEEEFEPDDDIVGASEVEYEAAEFSAEESSVANLFHNVDIIYDASEGEAGSFTRVDGGNETAGASETVLGSEGVDYGTMHSGDDTYYGNDGNDVLVGQSGADSLYGEDGDDIFEIGGFGTGVSGTTSAADDGQKEWIATGAKHDLIVGGDGVDTLRITTGVGADTKANGTVVLNDANFQSMEVVQVGATVDQLNVENDALQMLNDHYYFQANGNVDDLDNALGNNGGIINNVVVDASGVTANGLRFEGNADEQTFIGTTQDDVFVGNSGDDVLTGGAGADTFVFGKVYEQVVTGDDDEVQTYTNTAFDLTGIDFITDFTSGTDKIAFNIDQFSSLTVGGFTAANLVSGAGAFAADADDYLLYDTATNALSYDADGSGAGAAVQIATLSGVSTFVATDVEVFA